MITICPCGIARDDCDYHKPAPVVVQVPVPVHDVSGTCFIEGVTNFTARNLYDTSLLTMSVLSGVQIETDNYIFDRLNNQNLLKTCRNKPTFKGHVILITSKLPGPVFRTFITRWDDVDAILITREW